MREHQSTVFRFLTLAASPSDDRKEECRRMAMAPADWTALPDAAHRHGLAAQVFRVAGERSDAPNAVRSALHAIARDSAVRALRGTAEMLGAVGALADAGIPAVALKGPAFAAWLYGDAALRRFSDLDLLVRHEHVDRAVVRLQQDGYRLPEGMSAKSARAVYGGLGALPLQRDGRFPLDLHWRLAHRRFASPLTPDRIFADSIRIEVAGRFVQVPGATHAALLALLHAAKHLWCTLELLGSIARLMHREDVKWQVVRELAEESGAWHGCAAGLRLASELIGARMPVALAGLRWPATSDALLEDAQDALAMPAGIFQDRWIERRAHRAAFDTWQGRVRYDLWRLVAPTPLEWQWCPLPDRLTALYVPLRLVRLGLSAVSGGLRSDSKALPTH